MHAVVSMQIMGRTRKKTSTNEKSYSIENGGDLKIFFKKRKFFVQPSKQLRVGNYA